ncbi:hypothetical protein HAHE_06650 [Haloferula helveola]|uniref:Uncharacterized protein n=1 Tax=Haloferula helveola TaxID=490095 RepID=A0ABM7RAU7_9BACT|nr:hypothetical protein HAHE_06650 [Haloferula helveola]
MDLFVQAVEQFELLIDRLSLDTSRHFGVIGDPLFEGVRFYTFDVVTGTFAYDRAVEIAADTVDVIEESLMQIEGSHTLLGPIMLKLKSVAPAFNAEGKTVLMGSWGMGPAEIGWLVRRINERKIFEEFLLSASIDEATVNRYNDSFSEELKQA